MVIGVYWIERLREFLEEKIDEEDDSWNQNSSSQENMETALNNYSDEENNIGQAKNFQKSEISFLANSTDEDKFYGQQFRNTNLKNFINNVNTYNECIFMKQLQDQNRMIYQKIADAFMNENQESFYDSGFTKENDEQNKIKNEYNSEFHQEFENDYLEMKNQPYLDVIEMDEFDRIKLYQDHSIFQKIFKKIWYIKTQVFI